MAVVTPFCCSGAHFVLSCDSCRMRRVHATQGCCGAVLRSGTLHLSHPAAAEQPHCPELEQCV